MTPLKRFRILHKKSQQEVADYLHITRQTYSNYELEKRQADHDTLLKLADYFETSVESLLREPTEQQKPVQMPAISMFYGILIRILYDDRKPPHICAVYGDAEACYDFGGELLEGELAPKQHKLVVAWIELHKDELYADWKLARDGEPVFKIEPLR